MCGIAGIISQRGLNRDQVALVADMNRRLSHRGPDGEGEHQDDHIAMAMSRLSIIDLKGGWQPLYNEDRSVVVIANGEIYNYVELRESLKARGHSFATGSDCETIVHLYEEHGDDCVHHLRGMFALAIWDTRRRRLLLARDRMGEKPLYFVARDDEVVFASELKALIGAGIVPFELDPQAIHHYFHYGNVPDPMAPVRGVRKLEAGHLMTIECDPWKVDQRCYWRMTDAPPLDGDPAELIRAELDETARIILRSDVPVAIALSAGLDSSIVAALVAKKSPEALHAISVGYAGRPIQDERRGAKEFADELGIPFHEVELSTDDMIEQLRELPFDRDEPVSDLSAVGYHAVMRKAREFGVPVMLSGGGGDELFWGYGWVRNAVQASRRKQALRNGGDVGLKDYLRLSRPPYSYSGAMRWLMQLGGLRSGWEQYRSDLRAPADRMVFYDLEPPFRQALEQAPGVFAPAFRHEVSADEPFSLFTVDQPWPEIDIAITSLLCKTYLIGTILGPSDRLSMATSVELRLPFMDYRLVETVIGCRKNHDDVDMRPKKWLRDAVDDLLPPFMLRRRKQGFGTPWRQWWAAVHDEFGHLLVDGYLVQNDVLSREGARTLSQRLRPRPLRLPSQLPGRAMLLELWCRQMSARAPVHSRDAAAAMGAASPRSD